MSFAAVITLVVVAALIVALVAEWGAPEFLFLAALTVLMAFGVLAPREAIAGFGSVPVLTIGGLLIIGGAVRGTGLLAAFASWFLGRGGARPPWLRMMFPVAALSAFLNNTPIVAMFAPAVIDWCKRHGVAPSRLLMPLSFATIFGGLCTLIGTSTTLLISGLMADHGLAELGFFEIARIGVPLAVAGILVIAGSARFLLPQRADPLAALGENRREYLVEMIVEPGSKLAGVSIGEAGLRSLPGLFLMNIERDGKYLGPVGPSERILSGDRLVFTGVASTVVDLRDFGGLTPALETHYDPTSVERRGRFYEVVVSRISPAVGSTIKSVGFRSRYGAAVVAAHRSGERLAVKLGDVVLQPGDTLMLEADEGFERTWSGRDDFSLISRMRLDGPQKVHKAPVVMALLAAFVAAVSMRWIPMLVAVFAAVIIMVATGVIAAREVSRNLRFQVLIVIACAIGLARALEVSGAAALATDALMALTPSFGPTALLLIVSALTLVLSSVVTNVAAAAIVFPIAIAVAHETGVSGRPFAMAVCIAASTTFLTPTGYETNLMVYGPGGYRFGDYARLGIPLTLLVFGFIGFGVPRVWPF